MALAEVCGLNSFVDFNNTREKGYFSQEIEAYSKNFINHAQLAVPPYANVSELLETLVLLHFALSKFAKSCTRIS